MTANAAPGLGGKDHMKYFLVVVYCILCYEITIAVERKL